MLSRIFGLYSPAPTEKSLFAMLPVFSELYNSLKQETANDNRKKIEVILKIHRFELEKEFAAFIKSENFKDYQITNEALEQLFKEYDARRERYLCSLFWHDPSCEETRLLRASLNHATPHDRVVLILNAMQDKTYWTRGFCSSLFEKCFLGDLISLNTSKEPIELFKPR